MADVESPHLRLQQQIDCQLETNARQALSAWEKSGWQDEPGTDVDEAPLEIHGLSDARRHRRTGDTIHYGQGRRE